LVEAPTAKKAPRPPITPGSLPATWAAAALVWLLGLLPWRARGAMARLVGRAGFALGIRRAVTLENLRHAFPDKSDAERRRIALGAYENMAETAVDAVTAPRWSDEALRSHLDYSAMAEVAERMKRREPTLLASAHLGSWELFADAMVRLGHPLAAVVRPLEGAFNARVVEARQKAGLQLILQRGALRQMLKTLKAGTTVVQLIDQVVPKDVGVFVPFFGRPASTAPSLAAVALKTGAPLFMLAALRDGKRLKVRCEEVPVSPTGDFRKDVEVLTAQLTARLEGWIRETPEQWLWLHRRWKVQP
jgi:Kdo2-lipid IVA lauroyltransferase/acyltransferase